MKDAQAATSCMRGRYSNEAIWAEYVRSLGVAQRGMFLTKCAIEAVIVHDGLRALGPNDRDDIEILERLLSIESAILWVS